MPVVVVIIARRRELVYKSTSLCRPAGYRERKKKGELLSHRSKTIHFYFLHCPRARSLRSSPPFYASCNELRAPRGSKKKRIEVLDPGRGLLSFFVSLFYSFSLLPPFLASPFRLGSRARFLPFFAPQRQLSIVKFRRAPEFLRLGGGGDREKEREESEGNEPRAHTQYIYRRACARLLA